MGTYGTSFGKNLKKIYRSSVNVGQGKWEGRMKCDRQDYQQ